jgi:hypothetical protein
MGFPSKSLLCHTWSSPHLISCPTPKNCYHFLEVFSEGHRIFRGMGEMKEAWKNELSFAAVSLRHAL